MKLEYDERPWGNYQVLLDENYAKVKKITVKPGGRLSYQKHFKRAEVWTIVQGVATVTLDGVETDYSPGEVAIIPLEAAHRVANKTDDDLVFIEVQHGEYFGEDDIIRLSDDYGRS